MEAEAHRLIHHHALSWTRPCGGGQCRDDIGEEFRVVALGERRGGIAYPDHSWMRAGRVGPAAGRARETFAKRVEFAMAGRTAQSRQPARVLSDVVLAHDGCSRGCHRSAGDVRSPCSPITAWGRATPRPVPFSTPPRRPKDGAGEPGRKSARAAAVDHADEPASGSRAWDPRSSERSERRTAGLGSILPARCRPRDHPLRRLAAAFSWRCTSRRRRALRVPCCASSRTCRSWVGT